MLHTLVVDGRAKMGWGAGMPYKDTDGLKVDWPSGLLSWGRGGPERGGQLTGCRRWSW